MFLDAYGLEMTRSEVVPAMLVRQGMLVARGNDTENLAMREWAHRCRTGVVDHFVAEAGRLHRWREAHRTG